MTLFYKILFGYGTERTISIESDELEKAYGLFLLGGRGVFSGGAVDSSQIQGIVPDYNRIMGWNQEYRLEADDRNELRSKGIDSRAQAYLNATKEKVQYLMSTNRQDLIGKNVDLPELASQTFERREGVPKQLGDIATRWRVPPSGDE